MIYKILKQIIDIFEILIIIEFLTTASSANKVVALSCNWNENETGWVHWALNY